MEQPTRKLFAVTLEYTVLVVAEDEREAEIVAEADADKDGPDFVHANEVKRPEEIPADWKDALPYGSDDDKVTCERWLEMNTPPPPPYEDPHQQKLW